MSPGTVSIHLLATEPRDAAARWLLLSPAERVRATSFVFQRHAAHWIACRSSMRRILGNIIHVPAGEVPIVISPLGKPLLAEPFDYLHFSLSHCEQLALLAISVDGPVGVDLEPTSRAGELIDCESAFCHPEEIRALPSETIARGLQLLELWIAKEALLKAVGTGFSYPPETVRVHPGGTVSAIDSPAPLPGIEDQTLRQLTDPALAGYRATLSAPVSATRIRIIPSEGSTSAGFSAITAARPVTSDG